MSALARRAGSAMVTLLLLPLGVAEDLLWLLTPPSRRDPEPPLALWRWPARWLRSLR